MVYHFYAVSEDEKNFHHMDGVIESVGFSADPTTDKAAYDQLKKDIGEFYAKDPEKIVICSLSVLY